MNNDQFLHFRNVLLDSRREILDRVKDLETRRNEMTEPAIELEEEAQRAAITLSYDRLGEKGKDTIEKIDLALHKIFTGDYGTCEHCGDGISSKRLEAVPWTRLCIDCAREFQRRHRFLPPPIEMIETNELPDEYQGMTNNQILSLIREQIQNDGRIDTEELDITIRAGVLYLEGTVGGEPGHQILTQLISDVLGFQSVVDHLMVNEVVYEREDRTPGESQSEKTPSLQDRLFYDSEEPTEDLFDSDDDRPYEPPDSPLPYEEYGRGNENRENRI